MNNKKQSAFFLRKKRLSYNSISRKLKIPKSTISNWFSSLNWSQKIKKDLTRKAFLKTYPQLLAMNKALALKWEKWREDARREAKNDFSKLFNNPLFIAGVIIYWGEGDKNPKYPVRVANTDPEMLRIFVKFLKKICGIPTAKIKAHLVLYPDLNEIECKKYWVPQIKIAHPLFNKTQFIQGKHKTKRLNHGICTVEINSRQLKEKLLVWIENISEKI